MNGSFAARATDSLRRCSSMLRLSAGGCGTSISVTRSLRVGERTQTDVCIAYIDDIVDKEMLESIRDKIKQVKIDGLPLADKQLEEATVSGAGIRSRSSGIPSGRIR